VTYHHFCCIDGYTDQPDTVWEGIHKGMRYQEVGSLGAIWEASYPVRGRPQKVNARSQKAQFM